MSRLRYNDLATGASGSTVTLALGASLTSGATAVTFNAALTYDNGIAVPTLAGTDYIPLHILDSNGHLSETVWLTAYTAAATSGTITRGQEGTTGIAHSSGDKIVHSPTVLDIPTVKDARWSPLSGQTTSDEFNDASLDSAWVRVDGTGAASGNIAWTENADVVSAYNIGGDTTDKFHALVRPLSGLGGSLVAGDAFTTCVRLWCPAATNFAFTGLVFTDGTTHGAGNQVWAEVGVGATGPNSLQVFSWTNFGTAGTSAGALSAALPIHLVYVRLVMTATNTWRADYSIDGVSWIKGKATLSKTITPTHVGFFDSSYGTATEHIASYEFLRRVSGVS